MAETLDIIKDTIKKTTVAMWILLIVLFAYSVTVTYLYVTVKSSSGCYKKDTKCIAWWYDSLGNYRERERPCPCP